MLALTWALACTAPAGPGPSTTFQPDDSGDSGGGDSGGVDSAEDSGADTGADTDSGADTAADTGADTAGDTANDTAGDTGAEVARFTGAAPDFSLEDENPASLRYGQQVSPRDYLEQVSGWYFTHAT